MIKSAGHLSNGVKSSIVYTLSSFFTKGLAIITVPIFTRVMSTSEIGIVYLYNSWLSILSSVATLSLTSGGAQLALKEFSNERDQYLSSVLSLTSISGLTLVIIYLIRPRLWNSITGLPTGLMIMLLVSLIISPAQEFWLIRQRYEYNYKSAAIVSFSSSMLASLVSVLSVIIGAKSGLGDLASIRLFSNYSVLSVFALVIGIFIIAKGKVIYNKKYWTFSLGLSLPLIGNSIASQILSVSDRKMISAMVGNSEVGIYSTLYTVSSLVLIIWHAINASFVPFLFENIDNPTKQNEIKSLASKLLALFAIVAFIITAMAPEIVKILATDEYYEAIYIMPPIAAGVYFISVSNMYSNVLIYHKKASSIMVSSSVAALINIIMNYYGIIKFGYKAAAYTTLFSYIVLGLVQAIVANRVRSNIVGRKNKSVYDTKMIILISSLTIFTCLACIALYELTIMRYAIVVVIVTALICKRKIIISLFN